MARSRVQYVCQSCGYTTPKWLGQCPGCREWNTLVEEPIPPKQGRGLAAFPQEREEIGQPSPISAITPLKISRLQTGLGELDRVFGGGIVPGSVILIGGDPGIGKSTLLLQTAAALSQRGFRVLYITGEESVQQVRLRAERLAALNDELFLAAENDVLRIQADVAEVSPAVVMVDSIQTIYHPDYPSAPGSVGQVRECGALLMHLAKSTGIPVMMVGHVTKSGTLAGPRVLEHMVDAVLYLEGAEHHIYRILRAAKNRYGSTNEIGVFEMGAEGLREVANPSSFFLAERPRGVAGSVVTAAMEGTRPLLVEVQALLGSTSFMGVPRRQATGLDQKRLAMILAVLEQRAGLSLGNQDVFVNVVGGVRLEEPATDLAVAVAVASHHRRRVVDSSLVVIGELGLAGEVRGVTRLETRLQEAAKLGFQRAVVPRANLPGLKKMEGITISAVETLEQALEAAF